MPEKILVIKWGDRILPGEEIERYVLPADGISDIYVEMKDGRIYRTTIPWEVVVRRE